MHVALTRRLTEKLAALPESGMGYQLVDLLLDDGTVIRGVHVFNGEIADVPARYDDMRSDRIRDLKITPALRGS